MFSLEVDAGVIEHSSKLCAEGGRTEGGAGGSEE